MPAVSLIIIPMILSGWNFTRDVETNASCPCMEHQAKFDLGRFMPHPRCSQTFRDITCTSMIGAKNCYMSASNIYGSYSGQRFDYGHGYAQGDYGRGEFRGDAFAEGGPEGGGGFGANYGRERNQGSRFPTHYGQVCCYDEKGFLMQSTYQIKKFRPEHRVLCRLATYANRNTYEYRWNAQKELLSGLVSAPISLHWLWTSGNPLYDTTTFSRQDADARQAFISHKAKEMCQDEDGAHFTWNFMEYVAETNASSADNRLSSNYADGITFTPYNITLAAYHEVGHALCSEISPGHPKLNYMSIIRNEKEPDIAGVTDTELRTLFSKEDLEGEMKLKIGGAVAEELFGSGGDDYHDGSDQLKFVKYAYTYIKFVATKASGTTAILDNPTPAAIQKREPKIWEKICQLRNTLICQMREKIKICSRQAKHLAEKLLLHKTLYPSQIEGSVRRCLRKLRKAKKKAAKAAKAATLPPR